jgi:hypothetical protein
LLTRCPGPPDEADQQIVRLRRQGNGFVVTRHPAFADVNGQLSEYVPLGTHCFEIRRILTKPEGHGGGPGGILLAH